MRVRRWSTAVAASLVAALAGAAGATASPQLELGLMDEPHTLWAADQELALRSLSELRPAVLRVTLYWSDVARRRPAAATNPDDPAYDWHAYDGLALASDRNGVRLLFTILATPNWANGKTWRHAPTRMGDLRAFAFAAAKRYSGTHTATIAGTTQTLPAVTRWTAWNEPNLRLFLRPQWRKIRGRWVAVSPRTHARMCNAVRSGIRAAGRAAGVGQTVACGVTAPRGNDNPRSRHASVSPLRFLRGMKAAGARFDVYAHHPYSLGRPPTWRPPTPTMISLGNIDLLLGTLSRLYGRRVPVWLTEYAYRTKPPELFGVSWEKQAAYLRQAHAIVRRKPRIDLLVWFQLRDDPKPGAWASGLISSSGIKKPAYWAYRDLPR